MNQIYVVAHADHLQCCSTSCVIGLSQLRMLLKLLLCFWAVLQNLAYYAQNYAHHAIETMPANSKCVEFLWFLVLIVTLCILFCWTHHILSCNIDKTTTVHSLKFFTSMSKVPNKLNFAYYRTRQNFGGRKFWWIWRIWVDSPKFSCPILNPEP